METPSGQTGEDGSDLIVALPAGTKLRGYEIVSVLGEGGFGITYRAHDHTLGREVAIKEYLPGAFAVRRGDSTVVPRSSAASEDFIWGRDRFLDEARTLAKLDGVPGIVRVLDYLEANGTAYMIMALVRGETLQQRIKAGGPLSPSQIDHLLGPLLDGLEQVHAIGYLHRDIKPSNITLDARGVPTLIDFGASRAAMLYRTSSDMTAIFSPGYAAAEQFVSMKQGPWTDIYGLAATLYHAITGKPPPSAIERTLDDSYKPLVEIAPAGFDAAILGAIDAGMAVRAGDRPQSIAAWRELLKRAPPASDDTIAVPRSVPPPPAPAPPPEQAIAAPPTPVGRSARKRVAVWTGAAAAAIVVLGGGGYFVNAAIEERSRAEAAAAQKAETEARRKADEERVKAETEARLKAADEARRQQAAAAARKAQEEKARKEREAADAAARRQADDERARQLAGQQEEARKEAERAVGPFDWAMRDWMAQYDVKQASVAVLRGDRLVFARGYNGRGVDDRIPIWALSRAVTAVCVATLIDEGKLRLDDTLGRWLQPVYSRIGRPADPRFDDISVADLLTQRSGLPARFGDNGLSPGAWQMTQRIPVRSATADMLLPGIVSLRLSRPPGEQFESSTPNYLLLGQVIEAATGESYADACAKRVLAKAGISQPKLDPMWGAFTQAALGWSLSGPEYLAFLRLYRSRQPDILGSDLRRWLWEGDRKWIDARQVVAYSLGMYARPANHDLWTVGAFTWRQPNASGGPISVKQGTYAALAGDGTGWFASFDTVNAEPEPKPVLELEKALWNARKLVKSWPEIDLFAERGIRPVPVDQAGGRGK